MTESLEINLSGHPGSGKTVLLAALYKHLGSWPEAEGIRASNAIRNQLLELLDGETSRTVSSREEGAASEEVSFTFPAMNLQWVDSQGQQSSPPPTIPRVSVTVRANAGEDVLDEEGNVDARGFLDQYEQKRQRVLVIVMNPFLCNEDVAWAGFRGALGFMIRHCGASLCEALPVVAAAVTHVSEKQLKQRLFQVDEKAIRDSTWADLLARDGFTGLRLEYDLNLPQNQWWWSDASKGLEFEERLRRLLREFVADTYAYNLQMQDVARKCSNCAIAVTHVDLLAMMPGVSRDTLYPALQDTVQNSKQLNLNQLLYPEVLQTRFGRESDGSLVICPESVDGAASILMIKSLLSLGRLQAPMVPSDVLERIVKPSKWKRVRRALGYLLAAGLIVLALLIVVNA